MAMPKAEFVEKQDSHITKSEVDQVREMLGDTYDIVFAD